MDDFIRVTAKTVEDAITEALIQLGTSSDNIEYNIIEKGTSGFFGIGGKKAVIEARKKFTDEDLLREVFGDDSEKPKKEPRKENKNEFKKEKKEPKAERKEEKRESQKEVKKEERKPEKKQEPKKESEPKKEREPKKEAEPRKEREPKKEQNPRKEQNSKKEQEPKKEQASAKNEPEKAKEESAPAPAPKAPKAPADPKEAIRRAETFLGNVFRTMEMEVEIKSSFEEDTLSIDLSGDDMGLLIGKRGQTLDSLQYLTSLVVNKGKASYVRIKLDTEDYRNRRKATLENLARNIAFKVKKTRRPVFLEPMNPYERRIIHSALQNDPYVTTHSEGDEPCRKVVVTLKKR